MVPSRYVDVRLLSADPLETTGATKMTPLDIHFETTVQGIPVGIHVTEYLPFVPPTWDDPGEPEDVEYIVTDRKGYEAEWLERKMTKDDWRELDAEVLAMVHDARK